MLWTIYNNLEQKQVVFVTVEEAKCFGIGKGFKPIFPDCPIGLGLPGHPPTPLQPTPVVQITTLS